MSPPERTVPRRFDIDLTSVQEARAEQLHRDSIVVDLLAQHIGGSNIFAYFPAALQFEFGARMKALGRGFEGLAEAEYWPYEMSRQGKSDLIEQWYRASGLTCGTYAVGVHDGQDPLCRKLDEINERYATLSWLRYVTTAAEIRRAKVDNVIALYAHWQPVTPIPTDLKCLEAAYANGLRSFMLTYNRMNNIGVGCTERVDAGLSLFGVEVVKSCNELGLIVDVSHCGRLTTLDACRHSRKPVNANHASACGVHVHARGKSDDELRAIADTGGVVGVLAVPGFISPKQSASVDDMLDHMDYIATLVGWRHVAIGTDWPPQAPLDVVEETLGTIAASIGFRPEDRFDVTQRLEGFEDGRDLANITRGLVKRGYTDEQIRGILGENALRVFQDVCG